MRGIHWVGKGHGSNDNNGQPNAIGGTLASGLDGNTLIRNRREKERERERHREKGGRYIGNRNCIADVRTHPQPSNSSRDKNPPPMDHALDTEQSVRLVVDSPVIGP